MPNRNLNISSPNPPDLDELIYYGAIKLEITAGIPTWEVAPGTRHQKIIYLIQQSIDRVRENNKVCACVHYADVNIQFPDGSLKRPDIAIFCEEPPLQDEALTVLPKAVIEVINPGYEYKDVVLNPKFYLGQGLEDVVVVDSRTGGVTHYRATGVNTYNAPVTIELQCGCQCTVPQVGETG